MTTLGRSSASVGKVPSVPITKGRTDTRLASVFNAVEEIKVVLFVSAKSLSARVTYGRSHLPGATRKHTRKRHRFTCDCLPNLDWCFGLVCCRSLVARKGVFAGTDDFAFEVRCAG